MLGTPTSDDLLEDLLSGDETAFRTLVDRYHGALSKLALAFVSEESTAEEVVQETWLAVIDGLASFERRSSLKTWIFAILVNKAKRRATRDSRMSVWSSISETSIEEGMNVLSGRLSDEGMWARPPAEWGLNPEDRMMRRRLIEYVARAIEELPPRQKVVVTLRDVEGFSSEKVCDMLDLTSGNQRVLLHRGRTTVRELVERYVGEEVA